MGGGHVQFIQQFIPRGRERHREATCHIYAKGSANHFFLPICLPDRIRIPTSLLSILYTEHSSALQPYLLPLLLSHSQMDPAYLQGALGPVFEHISAMDSGIELDLSRIESSGDLLQDLFNLKV